MSSTSTEIQGEVSRVLEVVLDVTEKARLERSLKSAADEYRALFEHAGTAVTVTDRLGAFVRVNRQFEELSGYTKGELEGKCNYFQFVHPKDRERLQEYTAARERDPASAPSAYTFLFVDRWGAERLMHISVNTLPQTGHQICSLIDLTEKWRLEQEVRNKEQFLEDILRNSVEAIIAMDEQGAIRSWNRGAELIFGYEPKEIIGKRFSFLLPERVRRSSQLKRISEQFREQGFLRDFIVEAVAKDGRRLTASITRTVIRDTEGRELGSSAILRDVTESRRSEQRMIHQEKMSALGELAATLAHEIKNPLNSMVINMEVLKGHLGELSPARQVQVQRYMKVLSSEVARLDKVIHGVLDFARPMADAFHRVALSNILGDIADLVRAEAERKKIGLRLEIEPNLPTVEGSEDQLKQVFLNLVLNAIQAIPASGTVTLGAHKVAANAVAVTVTDTGTGIPRRHYKRIFDLYFSTKEKGSGLGLPLVKRLVTAHGGKIQFRSKVKHGTTFVITFPAA